MSELKEAWENTQDIETLDKRFGRHRWGKVRNEYVWDLNLKLGYMSKNGRTIRMIKGGELSYNRVSSVVSFSFRGKSPTKDNTFVGNGVAPFTLSIYDLCIIHKMLVRVKRSERDWLTTRGYRKGSMNGVTFAN